ncbi:transglycosylase domain-containing protein [Lutibacter sp.]|uniref:transglycosylase domain-containing protein n=1 Tax=Lutibacter sp. TaxID=1925666 RepID=UPI001A24BD67|nr:transglycosylase domain-containing protein [Lutibacter sp.]MBI9042769.1 penicillin-binding protein [Lutibacter sp.]
MVVKANARRLFQKSFKYMAISLVSLVSVGALFFMLVYVGVFGKLPTKQQLQTINDHQASLVFSSDAVLIGKYFEKNSTNVSYELLPEHLKNALIATEDKRFFEHNGVDTQSYVRVLFKSIVLQKSSGGGSTLTQQLVKNLYGRDGYGMLSMPVNKVKEIILASRLETIYSKEELLVLYLNTVPFGENVFGIEAAANRYFNTSTNKLNIQQAAVLIGLLKATTNFNPRLNPEKSLERRNLVLSLMGKEGYLNKNQVDNLQKTPLNLNYENFEIAAPAGYFVYQVKKQTNQILKNIAQKTGKTYHLEQDGLKIYTTLHMEVQKYVTDAIKNHLKKMQFKLDDELSSTSFRKKWYQNQEKKPDFVEDDLVKRMVETYDLEGSSIRNMSKLDSLWHYYKMLHAAVLITNPKNGAVIGYVGGNNYRILPFNMVQSHRQIASAFKPILYATALENGISPTSYLENEEQEYPEYEGWKPQNFDHQSTPDQRVAFGHALANSMNLPTVDLYFKVGNKQLQQTITKLGFPKLKDEAPSVALGTLDVSLEEIVKAYGTFANKGMLTDLKMIEKITDVHGVVIYENKSITSTAVFNQYATQNITAILQKAINEGTGTKIRNQYGIQSNVAGKTGTAQNYSNAWFLAYTPNLVIGTWVGASTPDVHFYSGNGSGSSLALPIAATVLKKMEGNKTLKNEYLVPFNISEDIYSNLEVEPFQEKGIDGFFKRLFNFKSNKNKMERRTNRNNRRN